MIMADLLQLPVIISPFFTELVKVVLILSISLLAARLTSWIIKELSRFAASTKTTLDDDLLAAIDSPVESFFVLGGVYLVLLTIIRLEPYRPQLDLFALSVVILLVAWTISRIINSFVAWYSLQTARGKIQQPIDFLKKFVAVVFFTLGFIFIFRVWSVNVGPIIAGLGIAGLAVALALQDSLSNFFAGLYLVTNKPIQIGQTIRCSAGLGVVENIGWRSVRLRTWENNQIIVPNSKMTADNIINYSCPENTLAIVDVGAGYKTDPRKVEKVLLEVARKVVKEHGLDLKKAAPYVRFTNFGASALEFSLRFDVPSYDDTFIMTNDTRMEIWKAFKKARIEIPFQNVTVHMTK